MIKKLKGYFKYNDKRQTKKINQLIKSVNEGGGGSGGGSNQFNIFVKVTANNPNEQISEFITPENELDALYDRLSNGEIIFVTLTVQLINGVNKGLYTCLMQSQPKLDFIKGKVMIFVGPMAGYNVPWYVGKFDFHTGEPTDKWIAVTTG